MKRIAGIAVAVALALGTAAVIAQPYGMGGGFGGGMMGGGFGPGAMHGYGPGMGGFGPGMMGWGGYGVEDRLAAQKSALKITPEQERAWAAYQDVAKKQFDAVRAQREELWKSVPSSSAERYELHSKLLAQRAEQQQALSAAYKKLYTTLTPEQRAIADGDGYGYGYGPRGRFR